MKSTILSFSVLSIAFVFGLHAQEMSRDDGCPAEPLCTAAPQKLTKSAMDQLQYGFRSIVDDGSRMEYADRWLESILMGIRQELLELRDVKLNEPPGCYFNYEGEWVLYTGSGIVNNALQFLEIYFAEPFQASSYYTQANIDRLYVLMTSMRAYFPVAANLECEEIRRGVDIEPRSILKKRLTAIVGHINRILR